MLARWAAITAVLLLFPACGMFVKQSTYNEALTKINVLEGERDELSGRISEFSAKIRDLEANLDKSSKQVADLIGKADQLEKDKAATDAKLQTAERELEERHAEIVKLTKDVADIRIAKDKEIADIKTKVKDINTRAEVLLEKIRGVLKEKDKAKDEPVQTTS